MCPLPGEGVGGDCSRLALYITVGRLGVLDGYEVNLGLVAGSSEDVSQRKHVIGWTTTDGFDGSDIRQGLFGFCLRIAVRVVFRSTEFSLN